MHFFIDPTGLPTEHQEYGAIATGTPVVMNEKFFIGSQFQLSSNDHRAFACQAGSMVVCQAAEPNFVNLIIKPSADLGIEFPGVKYYIYRGVLKSSFINVSGNIINASNSDFIKRIWSNWNSHKTSVNNPGLPDPAPGIFGYDPSLSNQLDIEEIFNYSQSSAKPHDVKEGEWIGNFGYQDSSNNDYPIGLEIVMNTDHFNNDYTSATGTLSTKGLSLEYMSLKEYVVDVSNMPESSDSEKFLKKVKREEILSYVDPCALLGMYFNKKQIDVSVYNSSTGKIDVTAKKDMVLYNDVLAKFKNKNRLYIDIRSEFGYSYNFYLNYGDSNGDLLKIKPKALSLFNKVSYETDGWPIYYSDNPVTSGNKSMLHLQLRTDDNTQPFLFIESENIVSRKSNNSDFFESDELLKKISPDNWTKTIKVNVPRTDSTASVVNVAHYLRMQYCRYETNSSSPNTVYKPASLFDTVFMNLDQPTKYKTVDLLHASSKSRLSSTVSSDFAILQNTQVYKAGTIFTFYASKKASLRESGASHTGLTAATPSNAKDALDNPLFDKSARFNKVKLEITAPGNNIEVHVLNISQFSHGSEPAKLEDAFLLSITETELNSLIALADANNISDKHVRNVVFSDKTTDTRDKNKKPYTRYELKINGISESTGEFVSTPASGVFVYTTGNRVFNSQDAGATFNVPFGLPDAAVLEQWEHVGEWKYDDSTPEVTAVHPGGEKIVHGKRVRKGLKLVNDYGTHKFYGACLYPADGRTGALSTVKAKYPVVVIVHGNGQFYDQYQELCKRLAKNGFIALSINCLHVSRQERELTPLPSGSITTYPDIDYQFFEPGETNSILYDSTSHKFYSWVRAGGTTTYTEIAPKFTFAFLAGTPNLLVSPYIPDEDGMDELGRAKLIPEHLKILKQKFGSHLDNNVGIIGHSRGGEGVVMAANEIKSGLGNPMYDALSLLGLEKLHAVISLAPSDQFYDETYASGKIASASRQGLNKNVPYFVLYGSRDYDISAGYIVRNDVPSNNPVHELFEANMLPKSGIALYDRSSTTKKYLAYVRGGSHNGFITNNGFYTINAFNEWHLGTELQKAIYYKDIPLVSGRVKSSDISKVFLDPRDQQAVTYAYFISFMRWHLYNESFWSSYFHGEEQPQSTKAADIVFMSNDDSSALVIDDMESQPNWETSSSGGSVSLNKTPKRVEQGILRDFADIKIEIEEDSDLTNDTDLKSKAIGVISPNETNGILLEWESLNELKFDVSSLSTAGYSYFSFRIANYSESDSIRGIQLRITDGSTQSKSHFVELKEIERPDKRGNDCVREYSSGPGRSWSNLYPTIAPLQTIRVGLDKFSDNGVDTDNINEVAIVFPDLPQKGTVLIDSLMLVD